MQYKRHITQPGESVGSIAKKYNVSIDELVSVNPQIPAQISICPNQIITIPLAWSTPAPPTWPTPEPPTCWPMPEPPTWPMPQPPTWPTPQPPTWPTPEPPIWPEFPTGSDTQAQLENQVIDLVNQERRRRGLNPLAFNYNLARVARAKSEDMYRNNYFSHQSPTYGSPFDMLRSFGIQFTYAAENIAKGQTTAKSVMDSWMNSPGHAANILSNQATEIGVGYVNNGGGSLWTQMFIRP